MIYVVTLSLITLHYCKNKIFSFEAAFFKSWLILFKGKKMLLNWSSNFQRNSIKSFHFNDVRYKLMHIKKGGTSIKWKGNFFFLKASKSCLHFCDNNRLVICERNGTLSLNKLWYLMSYCNTYNKINWISGKFLNTLFTSIFVIDS